MNNKGFTTVELVLTIVLVMIIMASITSVTYTYRDRSEYESLLSEVVNYKNTVTKILYDDIINYDDSVETITKVDNLNFILTTENGIEKKLVIYNETNKVGINYDGVDYIIPGSEDSLVTFEGVNSKEDNNNGLYSLDLIFNHRNLENEIKIRFVIVQKIR